MSVQKALSVRVEAAMDRAIALGQVTPRRTGAQYPEDAVQRATIIDARYASRLVGQQRLDHAPLEVGQIISAHADAESEIWLPWKPTSANDPLPHPIGELQGHAKQCRKVNHGTA